MRAPAAVPIRNAPRAAPARTQQIAVARAPRDPEEQKVAGHEGEEHLPEIEERERVQPTGCGGHADQERAALLPAEQISPARGDHARTIGAARLHGKSACLSPRRGSRSSVALADRTLIRMALPNTNQQPEPIRDGTGASIMGPRNLPVERENPALLASPSTDAGTIPNLKFSYAAARNRLLTGGWAREITERELPVAKTLAGVNMRLKPGGIRELHWHKEAEWAYMLAGRARITAVDQEGRNFVDDVGVGDLWNFPAGIPHSIQGLEQGCEFLLVFDSGSFSENETFLISDWFAHTPRDVLAKNFGVDESAFADIPLDVDTSRYIFSGAMPPDLVADTVPSPAGVVPTSFSHRLLEQEPIKAAGGQVRIVDSSNFPAASTIAAALVEVEPGAMRELHWHPNTDEWQYYISGQGRMTVFASARQGSHLRLPGRRRRLHPVRDGPLHREHRRRAAALPRDVPQRPLRRHLAQPVDGPHAARARAGAPEPGRADHGRRREGDGQADHRELTMPTILFAISMVLLPSKPLARSARPHAPTRRGGRR